MQLVIKIVLLNQTKLIFFYLSTQFRLKDLKKDIQEINWARKNQQTLVGERLRQLESQWVGLVSKNYEIEQVKVQPHQGCHMAIFIAKFVKNGYF